MPSPIRRPFRAAATIFLAAALTLAAAVGAAAAQGAGPRPLVVGAIEGPIGPATVRHVGRVLDEAAARNAVAVVLRIDTPGGLTSSTREIVARVLASTVPVVGYVAPPGAHAASAGTYILYATHVAAMAPGTNLGAATPVQIGAPTPGSAPSRGDDGEGGAESAREPPPAGMRDKAVNDAVAFIRSLAELRGRNPDWAESAVRAAASLSARAALEANVIEIVAPNLEALLLALDGRHVGDGGDDAPALATRGAPVERVAPSLTTQVLAIIANPNVALILMMIGIYGLIFEFVSPGAIGPGIAGAICLLLGLFALNQLPIDYAGLALIGLGAAFMVAEALSPSFGVLGIGGIVAFVLGASMLIDTDVPAFQLDWSVIAGTAALSAAFLMLAVGYAWRAHRRPVASGREQLVGEPARVLDWSDGEGHVHAEGERWRARGGGGGGLQPGDTVTIHAVDGLTLVVGPPAQQGEPR